MYRDLRTRVAPRESKAPAVAVALFEGARELPEGYRELDQTAGGALAAALARPEFAAAAGTAQRLYPGQGPQRLYVLGLGKPERFTAEVLRKSAGALARALFAAREEVVRLDLLPILPFPLPLPGAGAGAGAGAGTGETQALDAPTAGRIIGEGLATANFTFEAFKGKVGKGEQAEEPKPQTLDLTVEAPAELKDALARALTVGRSANLARELAATPPNVAHPGWLVERCQALAKEVGLKMTVIDAAQAGKLGMGGLLAVGAAGSHPPVLICLEHDPRAERAGQGKDADKGKGKGKAKAAADQPPILLVGKAVTFDTGGVSIKPSASMTGMKYDKCGGMAVIGAMHAIASLKLPVRVVGLVPAAENLVDSLAYRVDDILTLCNGVTVEVTNTDAEGRLILADALAYGTREYRPQAVIDLATLTGGVVVALGRHCAGAFCEHEPLRRHLFQAGEAVGERLWQLPLWPEHRELLKSPHADLVNSAGRDAHPIQGAAFLSHFLHPDGPSRLPELPWCHLDIAGVSDAKDEGPLLSKGPTGFGVRLLTRAVETWGAMTAKGE